MAARFNASEAVELLFDDQLVDSGDEDDILEDPAFPLPQDCDDDVEPACEEPLPQTSSTSTSASPMQIDVGQTSTTSGIKCTRSINAGTKPLLKIQSNMHMG